MKDRVGIGWRPELAAGILTNLDRIDVVEVIADDYFDVPSRQIRALRTVSTQVPVLLHGVSLGLASTIAVEVRRLEKMARLFEALLPEFWSEHLAFVRGGGLEIGHLAAPPRTEATIEGSVRNLAAAKDIVGVPPLVENVATLIDPPGSNRDEATWVTEILSASNCYLLLDIHNLYANAVNFGFDAKEFLRRIPPERIRAIHLAGGKWITAAGSFLQKPRLLDDHLHDIPDPVYELLTEVGVRIPNELPVILERDGEFPPMECLLAQMDRARDALKQGRALRQEQANAKVI